MFGLFKKHEVVCETCNAVTERSWQSILRKAEASDETYREAVAALNVKVICELAPLVRDLSKYESFRHEAVGLALSIRDGRYRSFAMRKLRDFIGGPRIFAKKRARRPKNTANQKSGRSKYLRFNAAKEQDAACPKRLVLRRRSVIR
jgi:hypothetical protein